MAKKLVENVMSNIEQSQKNEVEETPIIMKGS